MFLYNMATHQVDWVKGVAGELKLTESQLQRIKQGKAEVRTILEPNEIGKLTPVHTYIDQNMVRFKPVRKVKRKSWFKPYPEMTIADVMPQNLRDVAIGRKQQVR